LLKSAALIVSILIDVCQSVESTALHLIMGLGSWEVQPQLSRIIVEPKSVVLISNDSEELNRAMILTLARAVHVTGQYCSLLVRNCFGI